jgi:hypothetical protein
MAIEADVFVCHNSKGCEMRWLISPLLRDNRPFLLVHALLSDIDNQLCNLLSPLTISSRDTPPHTPQCDFVDKQRPEVTRYVRLKYAPWFLIRLLNVHSHRGTQSFRCYPASGYYELGFWCLVIIMPWRFVSVCTVVFTEDTDIPSKRV